jgi:hypothetical protein
MKAMSDKNNRPLNDRGKGLEDEWIRNHEKEQRDEDRQRDANDSGKGGKGGKGGKDDDNRPDRRADGDDTANRGRMGSFVIWVLLGMAAAILFGHFFG